MFKIHQALKGRNTSAMGASPLAKSHQYPPSPERAEYINDGASPIAERAEYINDGASPIAERAEYDNDAASPIVRHEQKSNKP
jgi:hypothetical protein